MSILDKTINIFNKNEYNNIFNNCFNNAYDTTLKYLENGDVFLLTGDIPAMWLRDSSAQVMPYLYFPNNKKVKDLITGLLNTQFKFINIDSYANAFMESNKTKSIWIQYVKTNYMSDITWERKFELDSLCWPFFLLCKYFKLTNDHSVLNNQFLVAFDTLIKTVKTEQHHSSKSSYFYQMIQPWDNKEIKCGINTNKDEENGLVWSGFRPSDDPCQYPYHIPSNMFLVSVLFSLKNIFEATLKDNDRAKECEKLINELKPLIDKYGIKHIDGLGDIYIYETNCLDKWHADDDANIPSLLSIPYIEYPFINEQIYNNTRKYILSKNNKNYYEGAELKGIGSSHTETNYIWPLSLAMQGITSNNAEEISECLEMLLKSSYDNKLMHESVNMDDITKYTRPWFSWANSLFAEFVLKKYSSQKQKHYK